MKRNYWFEQVIDEFFCSTFMKDPGLSMSSDADEIHSVHLVEMDNTILNIFI